MELKKIPALISATTALIIWFVIPIPEGVSPGAWHLLAIFVATIVAIIGKALPIGAIAIIAIAAVAITGVTSDTPKGAIQDALSSFSSPLIWLIGASIMISRGLSKTGLGARIGYHFIALLGKRSIGVGYGLVATETVLAPVTPSNTARGGGIIHPITRAIANSFDSKPEDGTEGKIGRFLALVNYHTNPITSAMFITATAPNPLIVKLIADATGADIQLSWGTWALAMLLPGLAALLIMPLIIYFLAPPEIKKTPGATTFARDKLKEMGAIKHDELIMLAVFVLLLIFWAGIPAMIFGPALKLHTATTAFMGLGCLLITGVLTWDDLLKEKGAWDTIIWFSALVMMATFLNKLGLIAWFSGNIKESIGRLGLGWQGTIVLLVAIYFYAHYFFASTTAHITAMFAAFYTTGLALGTPPMLFALILAASSSLMMTLTHYATGTAPVIFGSGYVTLGKWWSVGFIMSLVNLVIWATAGLLWWKVLGYW